MHFSIFDALSLKLLTCFRLNCSNFNEYNFRHNFRETVSPMCSCGAEVETTDHCHLFPKFCTYLFKFHEQNFEINVEFRNTNDLTLTSSPLFDSEKQTIYVNTKILNLTIKFLKDSGRFDELLIKFNEMRTY